MQSQNSTIWRRSMKSLPVLTLVALTICLMARHADAEESEEGLYAVAETKIKSMYDAAVATGSWKKPYEAHAEEFKRANKDGQVPGNWLDHATAGDWLKAYYYNMASVVVTCAEETGVTASEIEKQEGDAFKTKFVPCYSRRVAQMNVFLNIDNKVLTFSMDKFSRDCEPAARMVGRERRLPPYTFLKADNPESMKLMAFGVYLKCFADHGMPIGQKLVD